MISNLEADTENLKPCINNEDGCEEWAGCPCVYYKSRKRDMKNDKRRADRVAMPIKSRLE